ncbi:MAG: glycosyl hydrolase family 28 protein, partial [Prevotella sp.]|nr:glycosyl hydrolase family 28 protein [Prevotella sp.]
MNNTVYHAHGGFVIGSEFCGGMYNIIVKENTFSGTDTGLRFKSGIGRGGKTKNIFISDIFMTDIKDEAIVFQCTYVDNRYNGKNMDKQAGPPQDAEFVPEFSDIHISNVVCRNTKTAIYAHGIEGLNCIHDIDIDNCTFFYTKKDIDKGNTADVKITNTRFVTFDI